MGVNFIELSGTDFQNNLHNIVLLVILLLPDLGTYELMYLHQQ